MIGYIDKAKVTRGAASALAGGLGRVVVALAPADSISTELATISVFQWRSRHCQNYGACRGTAALLAIVQPSRAGGARPVSRGPPRRRGHGVSRPRARPGWRSSGCRPQRSSMRTQPISGHCYAINTRHARSAGSPRSGAIWSEQRAHSRRCRGASAAAGSAPRRLSRVRSGRPSAPPCRACLSGAWRDRVRHGSDQR